MNVIISAAKAGGSLDALLKVLADPSTAKAQIAEIKQAAADYSKAEASAVTKITDADKRAKALDAREAAITQREQAAAANETNLTARAQALSAQTETASNAIRDQQTQLGADRASHERFVRATATEASQRKGLLDTRQAELEKQSRSLDARAEALKQREAEVTASKVALDTKTKAVQAALAG